MKKNLSIEFMRYLMIIAIAILHFGEEFPNPFPTLGGALGVDFFFVVGVFYLAQHY